jgi:hypothetical protein
VRIYHSVDGGFYSGNVPRKTLMSNCYKTFCKLEASLIEKIFLSQTKSNSKNRIGLFTQIFSIGLINFRSQSYKNVFGEASKLDHFIVVQYFFRRAEMVSFWG